jgi:hypothetical protein
MSDRLSARLARRRGAAALLLATSLGIVLTAGAADAPAAAPAASAAQSPEARLPFANHHGIWDWQADGTRGIWVQGSNRKWYYGKFMGPCEGLNFATGVGFVTEVSGDLDRWSSVVVRHEMPCRFTSFTASDGPPSTKKAKAAAKAAAAPSGEVGAGGSAPAHK